MASAILFIVDLALLLLVILQRWTINEKNDAIDAQSERINDLYDRLHLAEGEAHKAKELILDIRNTLKDWREEIDNG